MKSGTKVRMTEAYKQQLIASDCAEHAEEFFNCVGIVEGPIDYGTQQGPEVDVRWQPSGLRYGYHPDQLVEVNELNFYVYYYRDGRYFYERTCGTEESAQERVKELNKRGKAVYLIGHLIRNAFY